MIKPRPPMKIYPLADCELKRSRLDTDYLRRLGIKHIDIETIDSGRDFSGGNGRMFRARYSIIEEPNLIHQNEVFLGEDRQHDISIEMMGMWVYNDSRQRIAEARKRKMLQGKIAPG